MKGLERLILLAGFATLGILLWKFNPSEVWGEVSKVGLGFAVIVPFQFFDHALNALGFRFAFSAEHARQIPFSRLLKARVAGDGVNYLTPSATIAGELIRPAMIGDCASAEVRNTAVVVAKLTQALGQALFILLGLIFVLEGRLDLLPARQRALAAAGALFVMAGVGAAVVLLTSRGRQGDYLWKAGGRFLGVREQMRRYMRRHPGRFALSSVFFAAGYAWGALEVMLICHFMGIPVPLRTALAIEVLSGVIESLLFMVPAKVGTQEAGKTAIFHALGYPAGRGLAFGIIRHARELLWAGTGFALYALSRRKAAHASGKPASLRGTGPLVPAD